MLSQLNQVSVEQEDNAVTSPSSPPGFFEKWYGIVVIVLASIFGVILFYGLVALVTSLF